MEAENEALRNITSKGVSKETAGLPICALEFLRKLVKHPKEDVLKTKSFLVSNDSSEIFPIQFASDQFLSLTGYRREEVTGRNTLCLQGAKTSVEQLSYIEDALYHKADTSQVMTLYRRDGTSFNALMQLKYLNSSDEHYFVAVVTEVSAAVAAAGVPSCAAVPKEVREGNLVTSALIPPRVSITSSAFRTAPAAVSAQLQTRFKFSPLNFDEKNRGEVFSDNLNCGMNFVPACVAADPIIHTAGGGIGHTMEAGSIQTPALPSQSQVENLTDFLTCFENFPAAAAASSPVVPKMSVVPAAVKSLLGEDLPLAGVSSQHSTWLSSASTAATNSFTTSTSSMPMHQQQQQQHHQQQQQQLQQQKRQLQYQMRMKSLSANVDDMLVYPLQQQQQQVTHQVLQQVTHQVPQQWSTCSDITSQGPSSSSDDECGEAADIAVDEGKGGGEGGLALEASVDHAEFVDLFSF